MKKKLIVVLLFGFFGAIKSQVTTESTVKSKIEIGVRAGFISSTINSTFVKSDPKAYFYAGLSAEKPLSEKFSIQAEANYTRLGGTFISPSFEIANNNVQPITVEYKYNFTQIQIPVSAKYYIIPDLSASLGMNFAFNLSQKLESNQPANGGPEIQLDEIKTLNLFPFLGAEYKLSEQFFVDARYSFNFFSVAKMGSLKIGFVQAGIGYRFR
ncbi:hypothetical protein ASG01_09840 [Chryseobacterium sp. Leaf180]|uniref:porin family protein n=1 Tax=Chryseobacterium sp. Leaf180 TaxID=1736289 RepID=UPI0006FC65E5|nr:porin family protein [Chryseobacterium sp. Leaf180]KQR93473.1 hypothetical protein ASG01_09840 [Chryseobacterium sp. Leaf180]